MWYYVTVILSLAVWDAMMKTGVEKVLSIANR
jgi:hypothetical protein